MAFKRLDAVQQIATGTGIGALTLGGATTGRVRTLSVAGLTEGDTTRVRIDHSTILTEWEVVKVELVGGTIVRTFDEELFSATGALISFSAGDKVISSVVISADIKAASSNRWRPDEDTTFYIRTDGDDDAGFGLVDAAGQAFQTFVGALATILGGVDFNTHAGTLKVGNGSYSAGPEINEPLVGHNSRTPFTITGNVDDPSQCRLELTEGTAVRLAAMRTVLEGFTIKVTGGGSGVVLTDLASLTLGNTIVEDVSAEMFSVGIGAQLATIPDSELIIAGSANTCFHYTHGGVVSIEDSKLTFRPNATSGLDPAFPIYLAGGNGPGSQFSVNRSIITGEKSGHLVVHFGATINHVPDSGHFFSTFFQDGQGPNTIDNGGQIYLSPPQDTFFFDLAGDNRNEGYLVELPMKDFSAAAQKAARRSSDQSLNPTPTFQAAAGTYAGGQTLIEIAGAPVAILRGNPDDPASCLISTSAAHCIDGQSSATYWIVDGFRFESTLGNLINVAKGNVGFRNCIFGDAGGTGQIVANIGASIVSEGPYEVDGDSAMLLSNGGGEIVITHEGTFRNALSYSTSTVWARRPGTIRWDGIKTMVGTVTGTRVDLADFAFLDSNNTSDQTSIPGSVDGPVDSASFARMI